MRHSAFLAVALSFCLVSACTPPPNNPVAPTPTPTPTMETGGTDNPFPRLSNPQPGQPLEVAEYFTDPNNGLKVQQVTITGGADTDSDGRALYQVQGRVDLGEKGAHDVEIAESDAPAGSGLPDVYVVTDKTATRSMRVELSADSSQVTIQQGELSLTVSLAGEETYSLNGQPAVDLNTAASQVVDGSLREAITPHAMALLYSRLIRTPVEETQAYRTQYGATLAQLARYRVEYLLYAILMLLFFGYVPGMFFPMS